MIRQLSIVQPTWPPLYIILPLVISGDVGVDRYGVATGAAGKDHIIKRDLRYGYLRLKIYTFHNLFPFNIKHSTFNLT